VVGAAAARLARVPPLAQGQPGDKQAEKRDGDEKFMHGDSSPRFCVASGHST